MEHDDSAPAPRRARKKTASAAAADVPVAAAAPVPATTGPALETTEEDIEAIARTYALTAALADQVGAAAKTLRNDLSKAWLNSDAGRSQKTRLVTVPGVDTHVATVTAVAASPGVSVTDPEAFLDAVEGRSPEDVVWTFSVKLPASSFGAADTMAAIAQAVARVLDGNPDATTNGPARAVRSAYKDTLLATRNVKTVAETSEDGTVTTRPTLQWSDPTTGELVDVPGVTVTPAPASTSFQYKPTTDGAAILSALVRPRVKAVLSAFNGQAEVTA